jgi:hypothetical protein
MAVTHPSRDRGRVFRATLTGDGNPGPIEVRIGRRLVRIVEPETDEGRTLLDEGRVELIGPGSRSMGRVRLCDAIDGLRRSLESRLGEPDPEIDRSALQEGLRRLDSRADDRREA